MQEIKFGFSCAEITSIGLYCEGEDVVGAVVGCKDGSTHVRRTFDHEVGAYMDFVRSGSFIDVTVYVRRCFAGSRAIYDRRTHV